MRQDSRTEPVDVWVFADYRLDVPARKLLREGEPVAMEPRVFDLVAYLIANRERAVGKDELGSAVWGTTDVSDAGLAQAVGRARKTFGDTASEPRYIETAVRFGYRWIAPTGPLQAANADPEQEQELPDSILVPDSALQPQPVQPSSVEPAAAGPVARADTPSRSSRSVAAAALVIAATVALTYITLRAWPHAGVPRAEVQPAAPTTIPVVAIVSITEPRSESLHADALGGLAEVLRAELQGVGARLSSLNERAVERLRELRADGPLALADAAAQVGATHTLSVTLESGADVWSAEMHLQPLRGTAIESRLQSQSLEGLLAAVAVTVGAALDPNSVSLRLERTPRHAVQRARAISLARVGKLDDALALLDQILLEDAEDHEARLSAAQYACRLRLGETCRAHYERLIAVEGSRRIAISSRLGLSLYWRREGDLETSMRYIAEAARYADDSVDAQLRATVAAFGASLAFIEGDMTAALTGEMEAYRLNESVGAREFAAVNLSRAAVAQSYGGERKLAISTLKDAANTLETLGALEAHGRVILTLVIQLIVDGQVEAASDWALLALAPAEASQSLEWRAHAELVVGAALLEQGRMEQAHVYLERAQTSARALGDASMSISAELALAQSQTAQPQAERIHRLAIDVGELLESLRPQDQANLLQRLAILQARGGMTAQALASLAQLESLAAAAPDHALIADIYLHARAAVMTHLERWAEALPDAQLSWSRRSSGVVPVQHRAATLIDALIGVGRIDEAAQLLLEVRREVQPGSAMAEAQARVEQARRE
ncbi:MAG: winged helix-turn-helix domain-containing protein [Aquimonas sp.]|nr:winged helix-turn-helix domain-containing protein [Aquimonas sp.]